MADEKKLLSELLAAEPQLTDVYQNIHTVTKLLGRGGQGEAYRTKDPNIALKIVADGGFPVDDTKLIRKHAERFRKIRCLPFPRGINIAMPDVTFEKYAGYAMRMLDGMIPLAAINPRSAHGNPEGVIVEQISREDMPDYFAKWSNVQFAQKFALYIKTGGLRRRLTALAKCAAEFARLNGVGLIYCDINFNNIFISENAGETTVWIIDADNIRPDEGLCGAVGFPWMMAPEIARGESSNTAASDCWSFAVLAFMSLTLVHPFEGELIEGDEADFDAEEEAEEKAKVGHFPWLLDRNDSSNKLPKGKQCVPFDMCLTPDLTDMFESTFGFGRDAPLKRPPIFLWPRNLAAAADTTVVCPRCRMSYYSHNELCPMCDEPRPRMFVMDVMRWTANGVGERVWRFTRETGAEGCISVPQRVLTPFQMTDYDIELLRIAFVDDSIRITRIGRDEDIRIATGDGDFAPLPPKFEADAIDHGLWIWANIGEPRIAYLSIL